MAIGDFLTLRNTTDTTTIAGSFATPVTAVYDSTVGSSGTGISYSSGTFTVSAAGKYLVGYSEQVGTTDTTANDRNQVLTWIEVGGTAAPYYGWDVGFIRKSGGSQECITSGVAILDLAASDTFEIVIQRSDNSTGGTTARIADRSGVYVVSLDTALNYGRYRGTGTAPTATDNAAVTLGLSVTDEQDSGFTRSSGSVDIATTNPVLYAYSVRSADHSDTQRSEYQTRVDLAGATVAGSYDQCYARGSNNTDCCGLSASGIVYPSSGDDLLVQLVSREDGDTTASFDLNLQLVELPASTMALVVEATTGEMNANIGDFAFDTNPHIDTDVFTHTAGTATITVDAADDYLAMGSLALTSFDNTARAVPAISFEVNGTENGSFGASSYNRGNGSAGFASVATSGLLTGLSVNDTLGLYTNRIGTNTFSLANGLGGMSVLQLSSILPGAALDVTVNAATIAGTSAVPAVTVTVGTGVTVSPATVAAVATVPAVTVTLGTAVTVAPATVAATASVPGSSIKVNETLLLASIAGVAAVPVVTVSTGTGVTVAVGTVAGVTALPAVSVSTGTGVTVAAATIAGVAAVPAVTVTAQGNVTVVAGTVTAVAAVPAVSVQVADGASPATIEAVAAVPAVTVTVSETVAAVTVAAVATLPAGSVSTGTGVTVSPAVIAAVATVPAPTITILGGDTTVEVDTVAATSSVPASTFTLGQGVVVAAGVVVATVTVDATVAEGQGLAVSLSVIRAISDILDLGLASYVVLPSDNIVPQIDVVPYHTSDPARSLARFRTPGAKGRNVFILDSGEVTTRQPHDPSTVSRTLLGGHESPNDLTSTELTTLIAAGYSVEVY